MTVAVKICGLMTPEHARAAVEAGARYIGLVFAPSRRRVTREQARSIAAAAREAASIRGTPVGVVGVFVNEQPDVINQIAADVGLDYAQLSGHEPLSAIDGIDLPVVKVVRFDDHPSEAAWIDQAEALSDRVYRLLVDANVSGSFGGAGVTGDWQRAAQLARRRPTALAGGLTPENVAEAIKRVRPVLVDVSSGVETDGVKDIAKIRSFIRIVQSINLDRLDAVA
jgi:phosphoribosylanthranilate isomerase